MSQEFDRAYWEERYRSRDTGSAGQPGAHLSAEVGDLAPGRALDAGCGEGANAGWLGSRGWQVTAVDTSEVALGRAREHAQGLGAEVAARIEWLRADLTAWAPPEDAFDLVTAHYVHPASAYEGLLRRLAAAVAPGGTLLIVDHAPSHRPDSGAHDAPHAAHTPPPHVHRTARETAAALAPDRWDILVAESRTSTAVDPHGREVTLDDSVLRARRRA